MPTAGVDFFRVDRGRATRWLLIAASILVAIGGTSVGAHLVHRLDAYGEVLSLLGGITMLSGLVLGFGAMAMLLFENVYLVLRDDGVVLHENGEETVIAWADLATVTADERGFLDFQRRDADPVRWFAGRIAKTIAPKIDAARRKAAHGILRLDGRSSVPPRAR